MSGDALGHVRIGAGADASLGAWLATQGLAVVAVDAAGSIVWFNEVVGDLVTGARSDRTEMDGGTVGRAIDFDVDVLVGIAPGEVRSGTIRVSATHALLQVDVAVLGADAGDRTVALVTFAAERVEAADSVQARRLEVMLGRTSDIITVIDRKGIVLYSNEAGGRITGIHGTEANGSSVFDFVHPDDHHIAMDAFARGVVAGEPIDPIEVRLRYADGSWRNVEALVEDHADEEAVGGYVVTIRDITDRIRREEEHAATERRLASIVENIDDVIVILDAQLAVTWASPGIERLIDAPAYTNVGENAFNDMHPDDVGGALEALEGVMTVPGGRGWCELRLRHRRLGWRWVEAALVNRLEDPAVQGIVCTLRDITDQRTTNVELRRLNERERESAAQFREMDRLKDEFLATVSHELRTPLTAVRGFSELLAHRSDLLDAATREQLAGRVHDNACQMDDMIEQLLDFSRLRAGRVEVDLVPLDVASMVSAMLDRLRYQLADHVLEVDVDGFRVLADRRAFDQVLRNLLSNAARYSAAGTLIEVWAEWHDDEVWISVRDHGIGIADEEHALVFQSFYQSAPGATGRRGTGVGLNIARRYAQLQHGRLSLESVPGEGSTFTLVLPAAP